MKLGVFDPLFGSLPLHAMLDKLVSLELEAVEVSTGGYVGKSHCDPERLREDERALDAFAAAFAERGLTISALSCHGNCTADLGLCSCTAPLNSTVRLPRAAWLASARETD